MATQTLVYEVDLKLDRADKALSKFVSDTKKQGQRAGQEAGKSISRGVEAKTKTAGSKAGANMGKSFKNAFGAILATISFAGIISQANQAINAYDNLVKSNLSLEGAVESINKAGREQAIVLNDTNASLEDKGRALGFTTDQMYEDVNATGASSKANDALERSIKQAERALEDQTNALEEQIEVYDDNIRAIEEKRDAEIEAIREARGFKTLTKDQQKLEKELTDLEIKKLEAQKTGDALAFADAEALIKQKKLDADLIDARIKKIDLETETVEENYEAQVDALQNQIAVLREEISDKKNKFDIDIEPARRKLEDLNSTISGGGSGKRFKPEIAQQIEDYYKNPFKDIKQEDVDNSIDKLFKQFDGVISKQTLQSSFANIFRADIKDVGVAENMLKGFVDVASTSKLPIEQAVSNLTQAFKTEQSELGDLSGLTDNFATEIIPRGMEAMQAEGKFRGKKFEELTKEQQALVKLKGLQTNFNSAQGVFNKQLDSGAFAQEKFNAKLLKLQQRVGKALKPVQVFLFEGITPIIEKLAEFVDNQPALVVAITGIVLAVSALTAVFLATGGTMTAVIGSIVGAFALFTLAYKENFGGFKDFIDGIFKDIDTFLNENQETIDNIMARINKTFDMFLAEAEPIFREFLAQVQEIWQIIVDEVLPQIFPIIDNIITIIQKMIPFITPVLQFIADSFVINFKTIVGVLEGTLKFIRGFTNLIVGIFTGDRSKIKKSFEEMFNGLGKILKTVLEGIINNAISKVNGFINTIKNLPGTGSIDTIDPVKFARGGKVTGAGTGTSDSIPAMLSNGEFVVNARATQQFEPLLEAINGINGGSSSVDNSTNINITNNGSGAGAGFLPTFLLPN